MAYQQLLNTQVNPTQGYSSSFQRGLATGSGALLTNTYATPTIVTGEAYDDTLSLRNLSTRPKDEEIFRQALKRLEDGAGPYFTVDGSTVNWANDSTSLDGEANEANSSSSQSIPDAAAKATKTTIGGSSESLKFGHQFTGVKGVEVKRNVGHSYSLQTGDSPLDEGGGAYKTAYLEGTDINITYGNKKAIHTGWGAAFDSTTVISQGDIAAKHCTDLTLDGANSHLYNRQVVGGRREIIVAAGSNAQISAAGTMATFNFSGTTNVTSNIAALGSVTLNAALYLNITYLSTCVQIIYHAPVTRQHFQAQFTSHVAATDMTGFRSFVVNTWKSLVNIQMDDAAVKATKAQSRLAQIMNDVNSAKTRTEKHSTLLRNTNNHLERLNNKISRAQVVERQVEISIQKSNLEVNQQGLVVFSD